ncbi:hypothetical protein L249_4637 [Ophiocordyceps polyrhachis-furcata BCC 54312]|uniref:Uncharacterized protein n=1 Tax=Ophiocordyceps polyrhachis-furcata BCC 54312 TaxID=1330021 RepID=A0A367L336_9HYPO|nr:hypothetical protein L249_4637 [Ophiocordyceps polyrhachis-furcata BCC 54312]
MYYSPESPLSDWPFRAGGKNGRVHPVDDTFHPVALRALPSFPPLFIDRGGGALLITIAAALVPLASFKAAAAAASASKATAASSAAEEEETAEGL